MPCKKCENGKYKWGNTGECKYATKEECEKSNPKKYSKMRPTPLGKKSYEEYAKELKEFNLSKVEKVELGLVQDGEQAAEQLLEIADELLGIKKEIQRDIKRIEGYDKEGFNLFKYLDRTIKEIEKINKELGITTKIPALSKMEKAKQTFNKAQMIKI